jgi:uncharacterized DUF497 family protein
MDVLFRLNGVDFTWDAAKASANVVKHGIRFERACEVFFDPLLVAIDASVKDEARDAVIGEAENGSLLFVVHIEREGEAIRIISARTATVAERTDYEGHA